MPDPELPPRLPPPAGNASADEFRLLVVPLRTFNLGQIAITANARAVLTDDEVKRALSRHCSCDWGEVCKADWKVNDRGVLNHGMILSAYQSAKGIPFWVIPHPGHATTRLLLPDDY